MEFNVQNNILFFRIGSGLVPFASHPICKFKWQKYFQEDLEKIGNYIQKNKIRISMHPDQFTVINSPNLKIVQKSFSELKYHCDILDLMKLKSDAKIQIHVGGVYGEKEKAIQRFIENYQKLEKRIKDRLVVENDDRSYSLQDCLRINQKIKIPILLDSFHHQCLNNQEKLSLALISAFQTWRKKDGLPMMDYSSQKINGRRCSHIESINLNLFKKFIETAPGLDFDIMLEIKDKEKSALRALSFIKNKD